MIFGSIASAAKRIDDDGNFAAEARAVEKFVMAGIQSVIR